MTLTTNAVITAIMAITDNMAITANLFITANIVLTSKIEKLIDFAAIIILMCITQSVLPLEQLYALQRLLSYW